jgi:hypothetical protein
MFHPYLREGMAEERIERLLAEARKTAPRRSRRISEMRASQRESGSAAPSRALARIGVCPPSEAQGTAPGSRRSRPVQASQNGRSKAPPTMSRRSTRSNSCAA